jgi:4-hydroxy-tetrahydrodipicolinate reductase
MKTAICLAGATGWVGKALSKAICESDEFELVGAVARKHAGTQLGGVLGLNGLDVVVSAGVRDALSNECDVFIDYTHPEVVKQHVKEALDKRIPVVIGTSGLTEDDFAEIDVIACKQQVGVLAAGNFAITAVLLQRFATLAAKYVPHWEVIDYAPGEKPDAPSGTARELVSKIAQVGSPMVHRSIEQTLGQKESRGATVKGTQIHSIRLPGFVFSFEVIFGLPDQRLLLRHDAGTSAEPYVSGTLLAASKVRSFVGLRRGLDSILDL